MRTQRRLRTKAFQRNPTLENEFYIAQKLGWKSVELMRKGLSHKEYIHWVVYFGRRRQDQEIAEWKARR